MEKKFAYFEGVALLTGRSDLRHFSSWQLERLVYKNRDSAGRHLFKVSAYFRVLLVEEALIPRGLIQGGTNLRI